MRAVACAVGAAVCLCLAQAASAAPGRPPTGHWEAWRDGGLRLSLAVTADPKGRHVRSVLVQVPGCGEIPSLFELGVRFRIRRDGSFRGQSGDRFSTLVKFRGRFGRAGKHARVRVFTRQQDCRTERIYTLRSVERKSIRDGVWRTTIAGGGSLALDVFFSGRMLEGDRLEGVSGACSDGTTDVFDGSLADSVAIRPSGSFRLVSVNGTDRVELRGSLGLDSGSGTVRAFWANTFPGQPTVTCESAELTWVANR